MSAKYLRIAVALLLAGFPIARARGQSGFDSVPGLIAAFSADASNVPDGTAVTNWADLSGNGYNLLLPTAGGAFTAPTYSANGISGKPALFFNTPSNVLMISNLFLNHKELATNITLVYLGQEHNPTNENFLLGWWSAPNNFAGYMKIEAYDDVQTRGGAGAVNVFPQGSFGLPTCGVPLLGTNAPFCHLFAYARSEGRPTVYDRGRFSNFSGMSGNLPLNSSFVLGNCGEMFLNTFFRGYVAELRIYNRRLTSNEIYLVSTTLAQKYNLLNPQREITLDGDSVMWGTAATTNEGPSMLLYSALGSKWQINNVSQGGRTSSDRIQNLTNWFPASSDSVVACLLGPSDLLALTNVNDTEANISNYCRTVINRGQRAIVCTLPSLWPAAGAVGVEGNRTNLDDWIRTNWRSFANGMCDFASDPRTGGYAAATNRLYFYTDGVHPNGNAYEVMMPILAQTVTSNAASLSDWRQQYFATTNNLGSSADNADPDLDGWLNIEEYAFHLDPRAADVFPFAYSASPDGHLVVSFQRLHPPPVDVTYSYLVADDPINGPWLSDPGLTQETDTDNLDGTETVAVTDLTSFADKPQHYLRVEVIH